MRDYSDYYEKSLSLMLDDINNFKPIRFFKNEPTSSVYVSYITWLLSQIGVDKPSIKSYKKQVRILFIFEKTRYVVECPDLTDEIITAIQIIK